MKKIILSAALCLSIFGATAFASDPVNGAAEKSFKKEFPSATALSWDRNGEYLKATFILDGHRTVAFFREDGRFAGSIRSLFFDQLPLAASKAVDRKFENADVIEVYEITNDEGTSYRLTVESEGKTFKLKVDANGNINETERVKK